MMPSKKKLVVVSDCPDIRSGEELEIHATSLLKEKFNLSAVKAEYKTGVLRVVAWGGQDVEATKEALTEMMENEFAYDSDVLHEDHATLVVYKVEVPIHVDKWFFDNEW